MSRRLSLLANQLHTSSALKRPLTLNKKETFRDRSFYKHFLPIQTRWSDNDQYGHINNSIYYHYFDTVVNDYLIKHCELVPGSQDTSKPIGLVVTSYADFYAPASYPHMIHAGLSITKVGNSSIAYKIGIFEGEQPLAAVVGGYTHVFVDAIHRKPIKKIPDHLLKGIRPILQLSESL
ncbi:HotDog domain-containing protein [Pilobolus umbonatus]|nr:HotDog domain-containing protein [Pilobolus umbonatus]